MTLYANRHGVRPDPAYLPPPEPGLERVAEVLLVLAVDPPPELPNNEFRQPLYLAQHGLCYLCGGPLASRRVVRKGQPNGATLEHVIPRAAGGRNNGNRLLACASCNVAKADRWPYPCELIFLASVNLALTRQAEAVLAAIEAKVRAKRERKVRIKAERALLRATRAAAGL